MFFLRFLAIWSVCSVGASNAFVSHRGGASTAQPVTNSAAAAALQKPSARYASVVVNEDAYLPNVVGRSDATAPQDSPIAKMVASQKDLVVSMASTLVFVALHLTFKRGFASLGWSFPSPLAGCGVLFAGLLAFPTVAPSVYKVLSPGASLLAKWLQVFLVPSLVRLPLAPSFGSAAEAATAASIIGGGFVASLLLTAYSVLGVRRLAGRSCEQMPQGPNCAPPVSTETAKAKPPPFADSTVRGLRTAMMASGMAAIVTQSQPLVQLCLLASTIHHFVWGARLPKKVTGILHPLVTCTLGTWASAHLLAKATGQTFLSVIGAYKTGAVTSLTAGAGDVLLFLLGPAIFSLGISMYDRRKLMRENMAEVGTSIGVSTVSGLFGTAALVRLLGLGASATSSVALSLLSRNITSALAMVTGGLLGADISLTVSIAIVTGLLGANFGARLLSMVGISDPVARGLAVGAASHGLGTAAIRDEADAFPFAAIAMTLVASASAAVVSVPVCQRALIALATGGRV